MYNYIYTACMYCLYIPYSYDELDGELLTNVYTHLKKVTAYFSSFLLKIIHNVYI